MGDRILVVERPAIGARLQEHLRQAGHVVSCEPSALEAFYQVNTREFDLLAVGLDAVPGSGIQFLSALRVVNDRIPVLVLSESDSADDRVACLRAGADDCHDASRGLQELLARVEALLRRASPGRKAHLVVGDLVMDPGTRRVTRAGEELSLTRREFDVLETLVRRTPHVVSRVELAREVWRSVNRVTPLDNVIDVHIGHLRKKIDARGGRLIHTARGVGFFASDCS